MEDKLKKSLLSVAFRDFSDKNSSKENQENLSHILSDRYRVLFKDLPLNSKLNGEYIMTDKVQDYDVSTDFHLAAKTLLSRRCPKNIRGKRWDSISRGIRILLSPNNRHLDDIRRHGWSMVDIFGCHEDAPDKRYDCMGVILLLDGRYIDSISEFGITLKTRTGAIQTYRKRAIRPHGQSTLLKITEEEDD